MKLVLGVLILVFALAGVACFGYSEDEMQLELDEQAAASDLKYIQELAELEAAANAISESLHGQIDAANREVTTALVEVAILEEQIITSRRNEAALQVEVDGLVEKLDEAHELLQASGYQIDNARTETGLGCLQSVHAPVVYAVSAAV